jgi:hypothetical protein
LASWPSLNEKCRYRTKKTRSEPEITKFALGFASEAAQSTTTTKNAARFNDKCENG